MPKPRLPKTGGLGHGIIYIVNGYESCILPQRKSFALCITEVATYDISMLHDKLQLLFRIMYFSTEKERS